MKKNSLFILFACCGLFLMSTQSLQAQGQPETDLWEIQLIHDCDKIEILTDRTSSLRLCPARVPSPTATKVQGKIFEVPDEPNFPDKDCRWATCNASSCLPAVRSFSFTLSGPVTGMRQYVDYIENYSWCNRAVIQKKLEFTSLRDNCGVKTNVASSRAGWPGDVNVSAAEFTYEFVDDNGNNAEIDGALLKIVEDGNEELFSAPRNQVARLWKNGVELDIEDNASGNCTEEGGCECYLVTKNDGSTYPYCRDIDDYKLEAGIFKVLLPGFNDFIQVDVAVTSVAPMDCSNHGGFASCSSDPDCEMLCISYQVNGQIRNFCYPHAMNPEQGICAPNRYITRFQYQPDTDEYCLQVKECGASEWTTIECAPSEAFNPADVRVPYIGRDGEPTSVPLVANPRVVRVRPNMNNDSGTSSLSPDYVIGPSLYHPSDALRIINDDLVGSEVVILQQGVELDRRVNSPGTFTDIAYGRNGAANSGEMLGFPPLVPAQVPDGGGESIIHCYVDEVYDARLDKTVFEYKCYTCGQQGMVYSTVIEEGYTFGVTFIRNIPATATFKYVLNKVTRPIFDMCQAYGSRLAQSNPSSQDTTLQSDRAAIMNETASPVKAFPNPFTTSLQVDYTLESDDVVSIQVFDLLGNEVMEVKANEAQTAGFHTLLITGADWPQGIYLVKMQFKNHPLVTKRVYKTK